MWAGTFDAGLADDLGITAQSLTTALSRPFFGSAWAGLEARSKVLGRNRVRFADVSTEIASAEALLREAAIPEILAAD